MQKIENVYCYSMKTGSLTVKKGCIVIGEMEKPHYDGRGHFYEDGKDIDGNHTYFVDKKPMVVEFDILWMTERNDHLARKLLIEWEYERFKEVRDKFEQKVKRILESEIS